MRVLRPSFILRLEFDVVCSFDLVLRSILNIGLYTTGSPSTKTISPSRLQGDVSLPCGENGSCNCADAEYDGDNGGG